ncbi:hypothetical protein [Maritalea sp.]|jgi:hypothetical protein|uniref:hypothetical protein n=1 Tax=Maritalea sp. TaxID=2003361 RepID=UPI0039E55E1E
MAKLNWFKLSKYKQITAIILLSLLGVTKEAASKNLDAGFVLNKMTSDQQVSYVTGIVDGLAYARWRNGNKDGEGLRCITGWLGGKTDRWPLIDAFFAKHPTRQPAALLYILVSKECGE